LIYANVATLEFDALELPVKVKKYFAESRRIWNRLVGVTRFFLMWLTSTIELNTVWIELVLLCRIVSREIEWIFMRVDCFERSVACELKKRARKKHYFNSDIYRLDDRSLC